jgi:hypothetical protein
VAENIRNQDTIEVMSPLQRSRRRWRRVGTGVVVLAGVLSAVALAGVIALGVSPDLRQQVSQARPGSRRLTVTSDPPGAEVFVDEVGVGATPAETRVQPGTHTVRVVQEGYRAWREPVTVLLDRTLEVELEPAALATLIVESQPNGAEVRLDGQHRGTTPVTLDHVGAGTHALELTKPRHLPFRQEITLKEGETRRIEVELKSDLERYYREAIEKNPKTLRNYTELLHLYVMNEEAEKAQAAVDEALAILEEAEASPTERRQFFDELSRVLNGDAGAISEECQSRILTAMLGLLEKTILAGPTEYSQYQPIVAELGKHDQFSEIKALCKKLAENPKVGIYPYLYIGRMFLSWGETSCAVTLLQRAAKKSPGSSYVRRYLASAYRQAGRLEEALAEYESLEKLVANSKAYYQGLVQVGKAKVLVAQEKTEEALACYKKAVALSGVPSTYQEQWQLAYAQLLAKAGRVDEAIEQYQTLEDTTKRSRTKRLARAARKALLAARAKQGKKK